jgi:ATP-dependent Clp protease ATP-binding subunit ClpA
VVSLATGVPLGSLLSSESKRLLHMEQALSARVVGQDEAIKSVSQCVRLARAGTHMYKHTIEYEHTMEYEHSGSYA